MLNLTPAWLLALGAVATPAETQAPAAADPAPILGLWRGTARAGERSAELALDIQPADGRVGLFMTLPVLHAWRMPVGYLSPSDGQWAIPDWGIALARAGDRLAGELGDPRVTFELARSDAPPAQPPAPPALPAGPKPAWTYDAGAALWGGPAVLEGAVYLGDAQGRVHSVNAADGSTLWIEKGGAALYSTPLATPAGLFTCDDAGRLRRLERATGKEVWSIALGADAAPRVLPAAAVFAFDYQAPTPVLRDGVLYVPSALGSVHAVDADDGHVVWRADLGAKVRASVALTDALVLASTLDHDLIALDRGQGSERWRFHATGPITSTATPAGDLVLVASRGSWITALAAATGEPVWERYDWFSWIESTGVVVDGLYYVGSSDLRAVRALDPRTGRTAWETDVQGWAWGTPAVTADAVYMGVAAPREYVTEHAAGLVALERKSGAILWRRPVPKDDAAFVSGYPGSVVVAGDQLFAANVRGTLEAYPLRPPGPQGARDR